MGFDVQQLVQQSEAQEHEREDSSAPMERSSASRRSARSQIFDFGTGMQPAHIMDDEEEAEKNASNEIQGFGGWILRREVVVLPNSRVDLTVVLEGMLVVHR
jgi:hypothetical protein